MPIVDGSYVSPHWVNGTSPAMDATEMQAITDTVQANQSVGTTAVAAHNASADAHASLFAAKQNSLTFDSAPTADSTNPVTSGGVKTYVDAHYVTAGQKSGTSLGTKATAEGTNTTASGSYSHAEGYSSTASAHSAHAEGSNTRAIGLYSHAEGSLTQAGGDVSHVEGYGTVAASAYQHVFGRCNVPDSASTYVEIVGNGINTSPQNVSNARTLDWNGNERLAGKLTLGAAPTVDMDAATKKYVDDAIATAIAAAIAASY